MQSKGFIRVITVLLVLVCLFYLSFSFVTNSVENDAAASAAKFAATEAAKINKDKASDAYRNAYDSIYDRAYARNLKDVGQEKVYMWYTYNQVREKQIGLGLDLKGGMTVTLQISVADIVRSKAQNPLDAKLNEALAFASQNAGDDFVGAFCKKYEELVPGVRLAQKFITVEGVNANDNNSKVEGILREKTRTDVSRSVNLLRERIDRFGVIAPNIKEMQREGQILMELPGVKEPERVYKLIQTSARLEFYATYDARNLQSAFMALSSEYASGKGNVATAPVKEETAPDVDAAPVAETAQPEAAAAVEEAPAKAPKAAPAGKSLAEMIWSNDMMTLEGKDGKDVQVPAAQYVGGACIGVANESDTAAVNRIIRSAAAKRLLPTDLKCCWSVKGVDKKGVYFQLVALRTSNGEAALGDADMIDNASAELNQFSGSYEISMTMNNDAASKWAKLTRDNIGKQVAIVLDDQVYSFPTVNTAIEGGRSSITGNFTVEEANDLVNVLTGGGMSAGVSIVSHTEIGPSLGQQAIEAGIWSFVIALILLMIYMISFYGFAPAMVANMCLVLNLFFTLGILASFQAVLTLPGICGIVLSLGMAVDANVLIFERTKEELRAGKNIKNALADGYGNAFSAIFDSNLTSIITALILYNFGTGPIRGFAMTLGIGICVSFFTAVWISRIVYEHFLNRDKWLGLTFTTAMSRNFLNNVHVDFMGKGKKSVIAFIVAAIVCFGFLFGRGLSKGIDFTGGRNYVIEFEQKGVTPEEVSKAVAEKVHAKDPNATVSAIAITTTNNEAVRLTTNYRIDDDSENIDQEVERFIFDALHDARLINADYATFIDRDNHSGGSIVSAQKVGPTVAADMAKDAIIAVIFSLAAIFLYILLRFRNVAFSIGSVVALVFDTLLILGVYSICWGWVPFSLEVDQTFIGAVLTAIGYSINDKVVVFDRMRENLQIYAGSKRDVFTLFNESLNSTLCRTLITSFTTLLVLICIFLLGGDSIRSFSFAMILGVIFGTTSSIFLAAPIAYSVLGRKERKQK